MEGIETATDESGSEIRSTLLEPPLHSNIRPISPWTPPAPSSPSIPTATTGLSGANGPALIAAIEDYDEGLGELLSALAEKRLIDDTDILFTLDHGKVDTHSQVALGTRGGDA